MGLQNRLGSGDSNIEMNTEFKRALNLMEGSSKNLFITGKAGTGKSTLLEYFRAVTEKNVAVLAPTGVAALNVKGQTIHSFFHFKPDITPESVKKLSPYSAGMYKGVDTIIIDEISMVRADLLDCIDRFMRLNGRDASRPFGGIQMIMVGDLYQLPPVVTKDEEEIFRTHYKSQYFFDSNAFENLEFELLELDKHYRQKDGRFIDLLDSIRNNSAGEEHLREINSRLDPSFVPSDSDIYITLTTTNRIADLINGKRLTGIPGNSRTYNALIVGEFDKHVLPADEALTIKVGSQIMLLNNDQSKRWVNGSVGRIVAIDDFDGENESLVVELMDGQEVNVLPNTWELFKFSYDNAAGKLLSKKMGSFTQYPIMLAWAVTIHKSQGKTFDKVVIDLGEGTFAHGQLYVALSRCTSMDGIVLRRPVERRHMLMDTRIIDFLSKNANKKSI